MPCLAGMGWPLGFPSIAELLYVGCSILRGAVRLSPELVVAVMTLSTTMSNVRSVKRRVTSLPTSAAMYAPSAKKDGNYVAGCHILVSTANPCLLWLHPPNK